MTTRTARRRRAHQQELDFTDPLESSLRERPRCECEHDDGRCRRRARFRVSALCAIDGCGAAVTVHLVCTECKDSWVHNASHDPSAPELRVTPL